MCEFLSFVVTIEKHPKVLCLDLMSHDSTTQMLGLKPEKVRRQLDARKKAKAPKAKRPKAKGKA